MMVSWFACCTARGDDVSCCTGPRPISCDQTFDDSDVNADFHDCVETYSELAFIRASSQHIFVDQAYSEPKRAQEKACGKLTKRTPWMRAWLKAKIFRKRRHTEPAPEPAPEFEEEAVDLAECCDALGGSRDCTDFSIVRHVLEQTRQEWTKKGNLDTEWATPSTARRMLRANIGDAHRAVQMFIQALEFRSQFSSLFKTMQCEEKADIRVIGRDLQQHPVIYMCAKSQTTPLRTVKDQVVLTMEAACRLTSEEGTLVFMVDMHGLKPHLNMDLPAAKDIADILGSVYAERIFRIIIVDFSHAANAAWWMLKPMLRPATREKFNFVDNAKAREICRDLVDRSTYECICKTFEVNRDPKMTAEDRALHARRTNFCVPPADLQ